MGWLVGLPVHGAWAFVPPGYDELADSYLGLRAWRATSGREVFMLAGSAAAWHLGYLDREPTGPTNIWLPANVRVPDGLRNRVSAVHLGFGRDDVTRLAPIRQLLLRRKLDIVAWSDRLPAFGPEALLVQLAARPSSFYPWADLLGHLESIVDDCDDARLSMLLANQSVAAWQRTAYLLHCGGRPQRGTELLHARSSRTVQNKMPKTTFEHPLVDSHDHVWVPEYQLVDRLVAPLRAAIGKA